MTDITKAVKRVAKKSGYAKVDIDAGFKFYKLKNRLIDPPGRFDEAGRFYADERTQSVMLVRSPSRSYPYSEMKAARTAEHCAELFGATPLHVKRICRALESDGTDLNTILKVVKKSAA